MRKISILHPSRSRPMMCAETYDKWMFNAANPDNIEYIISIDNSDHCLADYQYLFESTNNPLVSDNKSAIEAINNAAKICTGDLIITVSDDFSCEKGWDVSLLEALQGKSDFIVKTQDGIQKTLITLPIMDREYYNRFGYVYEPSYIHLYCDEEMTCVGHALGKVINLPLIFPHLHYSTGASKRDAISDKNDATNQQGFENILKRKKINFGLKDEEIVNDFRAIVWH